MDPGCREQVGQRHNWWFVFDKKSSGDEVFSEKIPTRPNLNQHCKPKASAGTMPCLYVNRPFSSKEICQETGMARKALHRPLR